MMKSVTAINNEVNTGVIDTTTTIVPIGSGGAHRSHNRGRASAILNKEY